jgi:uncharacterized protein
MPRASAAPNDDGRPQERNAMPRQYLRQLTARWKPAVDKITQHPWVLAHFPALADPDLWYLNRRSTARGVAIGLLCGLIPGPLQVLGSIALCLVWRGNFPLAAITTFYTNPFTIVPLYLLAYEYGRLFFPHSPSAVAAAPPNFHGLSQYASAMGEWIVGLGKPLGVGLVLLAFTLAAIGFVTVRVAWRVHVVASWRKRARGRAAAGRGP